MAERTVRQRWLYQPMSSTPRSPSRSAVGQGRVDQFGGERFSPHPTAGSVSALRGVAVASVRVALRLIKIDARLTEVRSDSGTVHC